KESVGKRVKCTVCGEVQTVPGDAAPPPSRERTPEVIRARRSSAGDEEDGLDVHRPQPRRSTRKGKKSKKWVWITVAAVLLLAGGGLALWLLLRGGTSSDFDLVPRD